LTRRELADRLGVSFEAVRSWELGRRPCSGPAAALLLTLAGLDRALDGLGAAAQQLDRALGVGEAREGRGGDKEGGRGVLGGPGRGEVVSTPESEIGKDED
jgi:transcriptional regulator with XRE-family HTH domain